MNFIRFTFDNYHSPDANFVRVDEKSNPLVIAEIKDRARFDRVDENVALSSLNSDGNHLVDPEFADFIYLYMRRDGHFKYGLKSTGERVYFGQ